MTSFRERPEFIQGRTGEQRVARFLQERGYFVIPSYDYSGEDNNKAPKMQGAKTAYVIPDLDVCREGRRRWVEVKTKTRADFTRVTGRLEHGLQRAHFDAYISVQQQTGCEVSIAILELQPIERLLVAPVDQLAPLARQATMQGKPMLFFPRAAFYEYDLDAEGVAS